MAKVSDEFAKGTKDGHDAGKRHQSQDELAKWVNSNDSKSRGSGDYKKGYDQGWYESYSGESSSSGGSNSGK